MKYGTVGMGSFLWLVGLPTTLEGGEAEGIGHAGACMIADLSHHTLEPLILFDSTHNPQQALRA